MSDLFLPLTGGNYDMKQIILASGSPRRKEILETMGLSFLVCPAKGEEIITKTAPDEVVMELAKQKAEEVASMVSSYGEEHEELVTPQDMLILGADTVVACDGKILGKPRDEAHAKETLTGLSGRSHSVYTGVCAVFLSADGRCGEHVFFDKTDVTVYPLSEEEIERYIATGEPMDKAGAYGIQGRFGIHVKGISGDYLNVVGLPAGRLYEELKSLGIDLYLW